MIDIIEEVLRSDNFCLRNGIQLKKNREGSQFLTAKPGSFMGMFSVPCPAIRPDQGR